MQGLIPDPEEEQELIQLNQPLLNAIGPEDDIALNDTDPPFGKRKCVDRALLNYL